MAKNPPKYSIADFRLAMEEVGTSPTAIANRLNCVTGTVYRYLRKYPELKTTYEATKGATVEDRKKFPKEVFIEAIKLSHGVKSVVAAVVGCSRSTVDNALEEWPDLQENLDAARAVLIGMATGALVDDIQDRTSPRHGQAYMYTLKTLGRTEGFVERSEVTGADGRPVFEIPLDLMKQLEATGLDVVTVLRNLAAMPPPMEG